MPALVVGAMLGPYEILSPLGAGGMGEVYRARDTRLDRTVAIKVLPAHLAASHDLRARFEREAKAVSSLNHPHICVLYDVGHESGTDYLVLEYLEGESLHDRLAKGPLPLDQALRYAAEIADALDKAHRHGVIHRDLKPGNVMLTKSGAKLLDFGLARTVQPAVGADGGLSDLETRSQPLTGRGTLLGTVQYMAPEQVEGKEADARTDLWSFGTLVYEMVTGQRAFTGNSPASLIGSILKDEPRPMRELKPLTPPPLERLVTTCLAKDPDERWQSAGDVARELRWVGEATGDASRPVTRRARRQTVAWMAAVLALTAAGFLAGRMRKGAVDAPRALHSYLVPPPRTSFYLVGDDAAPVVLSPNGAYAAFGAGGALVVQSMRDGASSTLASTEGAKHAFWSPDSRFLAFFAEGKLRTVEATGGPVSTLCDAINPRGGAWGSDGTIVFAPDIRTGLYRISVSGGAPAPVTRLDTSLHTTHRWPCFLPDGRHFVFLAANHSSPRGEQSGIYLASLDGGDPRRLFHAYSGPQYAPPGYLLFVRGTRLTAQPFDATALTVAGEPVRVADGVNNDWGTWRGVFSASGNGLLAYQTVEGGVGGEFCWFDRAGRLLQKLAEKSEAYAPRLSPDGRRLAFLLGDPNNDLWVQDLERGVRTRVTTDGGITVSPVWSADGKQILYVTQRQATPQNLFSLLVASASGAPGRRKILESADRLEPTDWSRDGRFILCDKGYVGTTDVWALPIADPSRGFPLADSPFIERNGQFSPDGRWVAYTSGETGRDEVYVTSFPEKGVRLQVSGGGAVQPRWRRDGRGIFFVSAARQMMAATVDASGPQFTVTDIRPLFPVNMFVGPRTSLIGYDVGPDGERFVINSAGDAGDPRVALVANWQAGLRR
jgi:Tol biopolymer transport system component